MGCPITKSCNSFLSFSHYYAHIFPFRCNHAADNYVFHFHTIRHTFLPFPCKYAHNKCFHAPKIPFTPYALRSLSCNIFHNTITRTYRGRAHLERVGGSGVRGHSLYRPYGDDWTILVSFFLQQNL